ncbi:hypothetical protein CCACVL1_21261 [Corchorus capsularis]|uniref:Uncharacterized protein n=1 Tax=Corchorus capsularis TaxID=210143 RepID=A0A1R3H796_COCAP|nr:hypothetical protein CCACVL1_21261 [Corchorus capsularis]
MDFTQDMNMMISCSLNPYAIDDDSKSRTPCHCPFLRLAIA